MISKSAFKIALVFSVLYGIFIIIGQFFLVTWGSSSTLKNVVMFMLTVPFDWYKLIGQSIIYLPLNVIFWSAIVYLIMLAIKGVQSLKSKV